MTNPGDKRKRVDFPLPKGDRGTCRSCGALIAWYVHPTSGKNMPLDVATTKDGRAESHYAHCPDAATFRRKRPSY